MKYLITLFISLSTLAWSQKPKSQAAPVQKKPLTHEVYDNWKEITYRALTNDGAFAAYTVNPQDGDGEVVFHNL